MNALDLQYSAGEEFDIHHRQRMSLPFGPPHSWRVTGSNSISVQAIAECLRACPELAEGFRF
jgi:hypothetical protein